MGAPRRYTRSEPPQNPLAGMSIKQLYREAKPLYQQFAHSAEKADEEMRLVIAGERTQLKRLQMHIEARDSHYQKLRPILQEIADRVSAAGRTAPFDIEDGLGYLTTRAQQIARSASTHSFQI